MGLCVVYYRYDAVFILHFRGNPMCANEHKGGNSRTPCQLSQAVWPVCYADGCYMNYRCPVYRGLHPNPKRDYIPLPPVFVRTGPYEAEPISYHIPVILDLD